MWECPRCHRDFKITNQWHSCYISTVEEYFEGKSIQLKKLYDEMEKFFLSLDDFTITPTKTAIHFRKTSTFAEIKLKKDCLILAFSLNYLSNSKIIKNSFKMSKNKIVHTVQIDPITNLTEIFEILSEAYLLFIK